MSSGESCFLSKTHFDQWRVHIACTLFCVSFKQSGLASCLVHWFLCHDRLDCEYRVCLATCLSFLSCVYRTGGTAFPFFRTRFSSVGKSFGYGLRVRASRCPEDLRSSVFETQVGAISLRVLGGKKTSKARNLTSHPHEAWDLSLGFLA